MGNRGSRFGGEKIDGSRRSCGSNAVWDERPRGRARLCLEQKTETSETSETLDVVAIVPPPQPHHATADPPPKRQRVGDSHSLDLREVAAGPLQLHAHTCRRRAVVPCQVQAIWLRLDWEGIAIRPGKHSELMEQAGERGPTNHRYRALCGPVGC
jgi:hypothetical protein